MNYFRVIFCVLLVASLPTLALAGETTLIPIEGERIEARFTGLTGEGQFQFTSSEKKNFSLAPNQFVRWGERTEPRRGHLLRLTDGSLLAGQLVRINKENVWIESDVFGQARLPLEFVAGILFQSPAAIEERDSIWESLEKETKTSDLLLLDNGDRLLGEMLRLGGEEAGELFTPDSLHFIPKGAGEAVELPLARVTALLLNPALRKSVGLRGPFTSIGWRDGSFLQSAKIQAEGKQASFTLACGFELASDANLIDLAGVWEEVSSLQPVNQGVVYLSDLPPQSYKHVPFLSQEVPLAVDRSVLGGKLRHQGKLYDKGLGMTSRSRLMFPLAGKYSTFAAELAVDDAAGQGGSIQGVVYVDTPEGAWKPVYRSAVLRGGDAAESVSVDVSSARAMILIIDYAERGDQQDYADWLDARLFGKEKD